MKPLIDLMKEIKENKLNPYNVWVGEEIAVLNIYQKKIEGLGYQLNICDSVADALRLASKKGLTNDKKLFVVTDDIGYTKDEKAWELVKGRMSKSKHVLILKFTNLDKRSKFYKKELDTAVNFEKLSDDVLAKYIKKDMPKLKSVDRLIELCQSNYNLILLESDKIKTYSKVHSFTHEESFNRLLEQGTIHQPIGDVLFKLIDAVAYGSPEKTKTLLEQVKLKGENELAILSLLYSAFRNMLMVQSLGNNTKDASIRTGLTGWQIKKAKENIGGYNLEELVRALKVIRKTEVGIKTGKILVENSLDYVVVNVMM